MSFTIDEAFLPATLTAPPMTDQQFADFCAEHPDLCFETNARGEIIVTPPGFSITGVRNCEISMQLAIWARKDARGFAGDSSTGFLLPNGARRSPDASWTPTDAVRNLPEQSREGYWHPCPAFVIELRSNSDRLPILREKYSPPSIPSQVKVPSKGSRSNSAPSGSRWLANTRTRNCANLPGLF
jgi:Uma2 family endonuclease